ncbi:unnamed protein product [Protopolystoma xenopodis]|uniref:Bromo domain-containing protein n=1 Tax=Protopolystoma xenopodis TaxID=117903 RepID=A0A3S4ZQN2_9PLAT|nr:unnamed protein product [Protopolystoma xenopodis]
MQIISNPMDLGTMASRLQSRTVYCSAFDYLFDLALTCHNAMLYNPPDTIYYQRARKLLAFGQKQLAPAAIRKLCTQIGIPNGLTSEELGDLADHPDAALARLPQGLELPQPHSRWSTQRPSRYGGGGGYVTSTSGFVDFSPTSSPHQSTALVGSSSNALTSSTAYSSPSSPLAINAAAGTSPTAHTIVSLPLLSDTRQPKKVSLSGGGSVGSPSVSCPVSTPHSISGRKPTTTSFSYLTKITNSNPIVSFPRLVNCDINPKGSEEALTQVDLHCSFAPAKQSSTVYQHRHLHHRIRHHHQHHCSRIHKQQQLIRQSYSRPRIYPLMTRDLEDESGKRLIFMKEAEDGIKVETMKPEEEVETEDMGIIEPSPPELSPLDSEGHGRLCGPVSIDKPNVVSDQPSLILPILTDLTSSVFSTRKEVNLRLVMLA